jgi:uncharacterized protein YpiB (UPF0302 family)
MSAVAATKEAATKEAAISFDMLIENKTKEIISIYEEKNSKTKCKKMTADPSVLDFHSKKLINQINAALDKKHKGSAAYKRKCEQELSNALSQQ